MFYHVIAYIKKARVMRGVCEPLHEDDLSKEPYKLLIMEQQLLDKHRDDPNCLNNNFDAYIPKWIPQYQVELFEKWKKDAADKKKRATCSTANRNTSKPKRVVAPKGVRGVSNGARQKQSRKRATQRP
jgi:hypothetical protein